MILSGKVEYWLSLYGMTLHDTKEEKAQYKKNKNKAPFGS